MAKAKEEQKDMFAPGKVKLPCGFFLNFEQKNHCLRDAEIKEMTGKIYTELGSKRIRSNPSLFNSTILEQCVSSVGNVPLRPQHYENFLVADQNFLVMKIRQLSKGDLVEGNTVCKKCEEKLFAEINLNDLEVTELGEPTEEEIQNGYRVFQYKDADAELVAEFRYPTISDINRVGPAAKDNPITAHNLIMTSCLLKLSFRGAEYEGPFKKNFIENLPIRAYESLRDGFLESQPGVDMKIRINCYACGEGNELEIDTTDFLASAPKKQKATGQTH